jgi:serine O-acetyltransferase
MFRIVETFTKIMGGVHLGEGAKVGLDDVPPGATAIGIPARILPGVRANRMRSGAHEG